MPYPLSIWSLLAVHKGPTNPSPSGGSGNLVEQSKKPYANGLNHGAGAAGDEAQGEDEYGGLGYDDDDDGFDIEEALAGVRGRAARAAIQRDMKRKQQTQGAQLAWQAYEVSMSHSISDLNP